MGSYPNPPPAYTQPGPPGPGGALYTYPQGHVVVSTAVQPPPGPREPLPCSYIVGMVNILAFILRLKVLPGYRVTGRAKPGPGPTSETRYPTPLVVLVPTST